jgi:hypothetical protein
MLLEGCNLGLVFQGHANIVQSVEQSLTLEGVDVKVHAESLIVLDKAALEVDREGVTFTALRPVQKLIHGVLRQDDG